MALRYHRTNRTVASVSIRWYFNTLVNGFPFVDDTYVHLGPEEKLTSRFAEFFIGRLSLSTPLNGLLAEDMYNIYFSVPENC